MSPPQRLLDDVEELRANGYLVDLVSDAVRHYVILRRFELPTGYRPAYTDVMIMVDYQYPLSGADMFWTYPHVVCAAGTMPQNADQFMDFGDVPELSGTAWQRWSYHYQWDPSTHSLSTHLAVFDARLASAS